MFTGATVHLVNEIPDGGRILLQKAVEMVMDNTIKDAKTQVLVLKAARLVEQKKL